VCVCVWGGGLGVIDHSSNNDSSSSSKSNSRSIIWGERVCAREGGGMPVHSISCSCSYAAGCAPPISPLWTTAVAASHGVVEVHDLCMLCSCVEVGAGRQQVSVPHTVCQGRTGGSEGKLDAR
jgi:hypothetical protein